MRKTSAVIKMFSCVGLDCEIRALFFISQPRCFFGSHRSHRSHGFARLMLNLTDDSLLLCSFWLTQISQISLNFSFDGVKSHRGWQMGRGACRSTLSAPSTQISKAHTNYFCWISLNLCEPKGARVRRASVRFNARRAKLCEICVSLREQGCVKLLWDLASGVQNCGICEICVRHKGEAERNILWDLWDFGGIIFCCGQFGVTL